MSGIGSQNTLSGIGYQSLYSVNTVGSEAAASQSAVLRARPPEKVYTRRLLLLLQTHSLTHH